MGTETEGKIDPRSVSAVRTIVFLAREFERACQQSDVSLPQLRLLLFLRDGPKRAGELAARVAIKRPTLTALVAGLERDGQLRRVSVQRDGRGVHIELTPSGLAAAERAEAVLCRLVDSLSAEGDRDAILDALDELAGILDREIEKRMD
jgi:DNA-binding MarR family transcriptional regulator